MNNTQLTALVNDLMAQHKTPEKASKPQPKKPVDDAHLDRLAKQLAQKAAKATTYTITPSKPINIMELVKPAEKAPDPVVMPDPVVEADPGIQAHIEQHKHTKKGFMMHMVILDSRVDADTFNQLRGQTYIAGGWYSRKWGTTPGGFAFKEADKAQAFLASL